MRLRLPLTAQGGVIRRRANMMTRTINEANVKQFATVVRIALVGPSIECVESSAVRGAAAVRVVRVVRIL